MYISNLPESGPLESDCPQESYPNTADVISTVCLVLPEQPGSLSSASELLEAKRKRRSKQTATCSAAPGFRVKRGMSLSWVFWDASVLLFSM